LTDQTTTILVGDRNVLSTAAPPSTAERRIELVFRSDHAGPERIAAAVGATGPQAVIVFAPKPGEGEAIATSGIPAAAWLIPPSPRLELQPELSPFKLIVATDLDTAEGAGAKSWTQMARPVSDALFVDDPNFEFITRAFFDGSTSERRDRFLQPVKHRFDVLHLVDGSSQVQLSELLGRCQVAINLHSEPGLPSRDRVGPALAAGLLVLAERPLERPDLVEGEHLVGFTSPFELEELIASSIENPEHFSEIRKAGHAAAELRRSSTAIELVTDHLIAQV